MRKKITLILIGLAMAGAVGLSAQDVVEEIAAIVNDDIITVSEVREQHDQYVQMLRAQYQGEEFEKQYANIKKELMNMMVTEVLILQQAREKNLNVAEQVKMAVDGIKKENNLVTDEDLRRALQQQGIEYDQWIKQVQQNYQKQALIYMEVDRSIVLDDSEVVQYYKRNPEEFTQPTEYKLGAIYLTDENTGAAELEEKRREIGDKLKAGEDFNSLSAAYSDGPMKDAKGELGTFKAGELEKALEEPVQKLKAGEVTDWIQMKNGWFLLKLEDRKESFLRPFDDVKKDVEEKLFTEKKKTKVDAYLKALREKSFIKILKPNPLES